MGYGPHAPKEKTWFDSIRAEHGTWAELQKLKKAERAEAEAAKKGSSGESLLTIPRGQYQRLDAFDDLLETGARIAKDQRRWLVGIPCSFAFCTGGALGYMAYSIFSAGLVDGLSPAQVVAQYALQVQLLIVFLCWSFVLMLAALSPTNVKGICYMCIGLIAYFLVCGTVICPVGMPIILPDKSGTVYKLWMICGMIKCMAFIALLIWAMLTQPPRKCLRVMEWGLMGVVVGIGVFEMLACYFCIKDSGGKVAKGFFQGYAIMGVVCIISGIVCVTDYPRLAGRKFLERLHKWTSPSTSFDYQCLAATIAIMVGADANFRSIICKALGVLRAVSLADVTWDEFKQNTPDPRCYLKSRKVTFDQVDYFISHSWSDDPVAKWDAVQAMRKEFKAKNGREPLVWFDKYCIDQNAIDQSVRRLPIFVVSAQKFFVLLGPSYAARCWVREHAETHQPVCPREPTCEELAMRVARSVLALAVHARAVCVQRGDALWPLQADRSRHRPSQEPGRRQPLPDRARKDLQHSQHAVLPRRRPSEHLWHRRDGRRWLQGLRHGGPCARCRGS